MCSFALSNIMLWSANRWLYRQCPDTAAPPLSRICATSMLWTWAASERGVNPNSLAVSGSAPFSSNSVTVAPFLNFAAKYRGVTTYSFLSLTLAPNSISNHTLLSWLFSTERWITESPLMCLVCALNPLCNQDVDCSTSLCHTTWTISIIVARMWRVFDDVHLHQ